MRLSIPGYGYKLGPDGSTIVGWQKPPAPVAPAPTPAPVAKSYDVYDSKGKITARQVTEEIGIRDTTPWLGWSLLASRPRTPELGVARGDVLFAESPQWSLVLDPGTASIQALALALLSLNPLLTRTRASSSPAASCAASWAAWAASWAAAEAAAPINLIALAEQATS
jgi:hypothetical protein